MILAAYFTHSMDENGGSWCAVLGSPFSSRIKYHVSCPGSLFFVLFLYQEARDGGLRCHTHGISCTHVQGHTGATRHHPEDSRGGTSDGEQHERSALAFHCC